MEEEAEALVQKDEWDDLQLPFPVATLEDLRQRAYLTPEGVPEWLFSRVHAFCQIISEPGKLLRLNQAKIREDFATLQIPTTNLHYRVPAAQEEPERQWKDHTLESGGLLATLLRVTRNRSLKAINKLQLLLGLASQAFTSSSAFQMPLQAMLTNAQGVLVSRELAFNPQQLCNKWGEFLRMSPGATALWHMLGHRCWLNRCIASSIDNASFLDVWLFLTYIWCHPTLKKAGQTIYQVFGKVFLAELLHRTAKGLDEIATTKSKEALRQLPILRTKAGNARKAADPVNRLLLLFKLRHEKLHRKRVASTHDELGGSSNRMILFENYVDCMLHMQALQQRFSDVTQVSVTWDPSTYGGKETFIGIVYSPFKDAAAYLMSQQLSQIRISELGLSLLPLVQKRKLKRVEGFKEIKGLHCALEGIGLSLSHFKVPPGLCCRPLKASELRVKGQDGLWYIYDEDTESFVAEVPADLDLGSVPCLLSISDQGPNVLAALNFLTYSQEALMLWASFDPYHRAWNDLKAALRKSMCGGWRTVLELTLVANLSYGPFGSSAWFFKKKSKLEDFLSTCDSNSIQWQQYQHLICQERRIDEPSDPLAAEDLFSTLKTMEAFHQKGPLIKLMRWFSFFESMAFHEGQLMATKMILQHTLDQEPESGKDIEELPKEEDDHKKELQALKKRKGTWVLAPQLITGKSLCIKDIILSVGKASWQIFSAMARDVLSPLQVLQQNIACVQSNAWLLEVTEMINTSLYDQRHLQHLRPQFRSHPQALVWHCDVLDKLLESRTMSLCAFHCLPPNCYAHALAPTPSISRLAFDLAVKHFAILLEAESACNSGARVDPLATMHWRHIAQNFAFSL